MHTLEITPAEAALEAPDTAAALSALAARHNVSDHPHSICTLIEAVKGFGLVNRFADS